MRQILAILALTAVAAVSPSVSEAGVLGCHGSRVCVCYEETCVWMPYTDPMCFWVEVAGSGRTVCV